MLAGLRLHKRTTFLPCSSSGLRYLARPLTTVRGSEVYRQEGGDGKKRGEGQGKGRGERGRERGRGKIVSEKGYSVIIPFSPMSTFSTYSEVTLESGCFKKHNSITHTHTLIHYIVMFYLVNWDDHAHSEIQSGDVYWSLRLCPSTSSLLPSSSSSLLLYCSHSTTHNRHTFNVEDIIVASVIKIIWWKKLVIWWIQSSWTVQPLDTWQYLMLTHQGLVNFKPTKFLILVKCIWIYLHQDMPCLWPFAYVHQLKTWCGLAPKAENKNLSNTSRLVTG